MNEIRRLMELNKTDVEVLFAIKKGMCTTANKIAKKKGKDRSVIQKSLNNLVRKGLVDRRSECCDQKKGRYYVYCSKKSKELEKVVKKESQKLLKKCLEVIL
ncbi:MAG: hypothetical protein GOU97_02820 [Nanoarchaeota archaeon]|nr:hypothetical protein [Nanoarchaeota archaeon]